MNLNQDLCYVLGALRDGCLTSQNTVKFKQKNKAWLSNVIIPKLNSVFGTSLEETQIYEQNDVTTRYYLAFKNKRVHAALKGLLEASEGTVPKAFQEMSEEQKKFFIQGFWDAEGGCPRKPSSDKKFYLNFTQKDSVVLEHIKRFLEKRGISCGEIRINDSLHAVHRFSITEADSIISFTNEIGSQHPDKSQRLFLMKALLSAREGEPAVRSPP